MLKNTAIIGDTVSRARMSIFRKGSIVAFVLFAGCATSATSTRGRPRPSRVAVVQLKTVGVTGHTARKVQTWVSREIGRVAHVFEAEQVDRAVRGLRACAGADKERCAVDTGRKLAASHVVVLAIGRLGKTFLLQVQVHDLRKNTVSTLEESRFGDQRDLPRAGRVLVRRHFGSPPAARPWYKQWWLWTAVAAVAAGATVAVVVGVQQEKSAPDIQVPFP